jgi:hypothetical protein
MDTIDFIGTIHDPSGRDIDGDYPYSEALNTLSKYPTISLSEEMHLFAGIQRGIVKNLSFMDMCSGANGEKVQELLIDSPKVSADTRWKTKSIMARTGEWIKVVTKTNWEIRVLDIKGIKVWECKYRSATATIELTPGNHVYFVSVSCPMCKNAPHCMCFTSLDEEVIGEMDATIAQFEWEKEWRGSMVKALKGALSAANSLYI